MYLQEGLMSSWKVIWINFTIYTSLVYAGICSRQQWMDKELTWKVVAVTCSTCKLKFATGLENFSRAKKFREFCNSLVLMIKILGIRYQGNAIEFLRDFIFFQDFLFLVWLFEQIESMDMADVLQDAGCADSRTWPDLMCKLRISSIITISHPADCLICTNEIMISLGFYCKWWEDGNSGGGWFMLGFGWGDRRKLSYFSCLLTFGGCC